MNKHRIVLVGGSPDELRVSSSVLAQMLLALQRASYEATRYLLDDVGGYSSEFPKARQNAGEFDVTELRPGSVALSVEQPSLSEAYPEWFERSLQAELQLETEDSGELVDALAPYAEASPLELMARYCEQVVQRPDAEVDADAPLLKSFSKALDVALNAGFDGIRLDNGIGSSRVLELNSSSAQKLKRLCEVIPDPQAVRVMGRLNSVVVSAKRIEIVLGNGDTVKCRLDAFDVAEIRALLDQDVVVSGIAHYSPGRTLRRVDAERVEAARPEDQIFQQLPEPSKNKLEIDRRQLRGAGVAAFFGTWPGDESDDELLNALEELR